MPSTGAPDHVFPPVVDLSADDAVDRIDAACRQVGFFQVVGHGIDATTITTVFEQVDAFFGQPLAAKLAWSSPTPEIERGYSARGTEGLAYSLGLDQPPDLFEAFTLARDEYPPDDPVFDDFRHHFFEPNIWPSGLPEFRPVLTGYYTRVQAVAHRLTTLFAVALGMEADFFEQRTGHSLDTLRINYFEGLPGEQPLPDQYGIGPHTDYGILTVLLTDHTPGLQVSVPDGRWTDVSPVEGALVVNIADMLAQWTNDHWRSTLHRVLPVRARRGRPVRRRSLPFFHEGDFDVVVECLPTCHGRDDPPRYPPVLAGEHVMAKVLSGRLLTAADAGSTLGDRSAGNGAQP
jgi:isopenicillin N synthase-like dioxygenase